MNQKLNKDWNHGQGLFKKSILYPEYEYDEEILIEILKIIWLNLDLNLESDEIFFLNDWHNHDGHISEEILISKKEFKNIITNPKEILKNRDFYVYDLVYDKLETFMLRWYCQDEGENEIYCDLTLILADKEELKKIKKIITDSLNGIELKIEGSKQYFDKRYGG